MHVADQILVEAFEVQIGSERVGPEAVFPDWSRLDRFGIVVTEPMRSPFVRSSHRSRCQAGPIPRWLPTDTGGPGSRASRGRGTPTGSRSCGRALAARLRSGELVEAYRRITTAEVLAYIAGGFRACADVR